MLCCLIGRDQYSEILMKKWVAVFNKIFDEDNYTPIFVETEPEYAAITRVYPFRDGALEKVSTIFIRFSVQNMLLKVLNIGVWGS